MTDYPMCLKRRAIVLYSCDLVPKRINRHNQRQWLRSVTLLGERWVFAVPTGRIAT